MSRLVIGAVRVEKPAKALLYQALEAIEAIAGDDQCAEWDMQALARPFTGDALLMHQKLAAIYRLAHSALPHICYDSHDDWRAGAAS